MKKLWGYLTLYDKILIIFLIVISVTSIVYPVINVFSSGNSNNGQQFIIIQSKNGIQNRIPLQDTYKKEPLIVKVVGPIGTSLVEAHNGQVRLKKAPSADPQKICEKTGWISQPGPVIICVPNKISIWIEARENDLDGVSW